ncbi:MAG TPA: hypothetical protein VF108_05755 [Actinomycetota bacterium]
MITGDLARERIADRVREADAFRRSRTTRRGSQLAQRAAARKVYSGLVAVLAAPFRH